MKHRNIREVVEYMVEEIPENEILYRPECVWGWATGCPLCRFYAAFSRGKYWEECDVCCVSWRHCVGLYNSCGQTQDELELITNKDFRDALKDLLKIIIDNDIKA